MKRTRCFAVGAFALLSAAGCATEPATGFGFGALLARTVLVLVAVSALAVVSLRWLAGRGFGQAARGVANLDVVERVSVGPRQSVIAVRAADRVLIVGVSGQRFDALGDVPLAAWERRAAELPGTAALVEPHDRAQHPAHRASAADHDVAENAPRRTFSQVLAASEALAVATASSAPHQFPAADVAATAVAATDVAATDVAATDVAATDVAATDEAAAHEAVTHEAATDEAAAYEAVTYEVATDEAAQ